MADWKRYEARPCTLTSMRQVFAHDAVVDMDPDADAAALGAAVTVALCGHWEHPPPCPEAPHHTDAVRADRGVHLRILFATDPDREQAVRRRIEAALATGRLRGADGTLTRWRLRSSNTGAVIAAEADHGERLARG